MATYEIFGKPDIEKELMTAFDMPSYYSFYSTIANEYEYFKFTDALSDEQRLAEYSQIYQQLKKFVGTKMAPVISRKDDLRSLVSWVEDQIVRCDVYPLTRVQMVYNSLKVSWLTKLLNQVHALQTQMNGGM